MHIKLLGYKVPKIHLPTIHTGEKDHDSYSSGDYEPCSTVGGVMARVRHNPKSWSAHEGKDGGMMHVIDMEHKELASAKASGDHDDIVRELEELAAACICALEKMKHM